MYDLLDENIIRIDEERVSLPGLLDALGRNRVRHYPGLMHHQEAPLHAFLSMLSAAALVRSGETSPIQSKDAWREMLLNLSSGDRDAWHLIGATDVRPAFLQPPYVAQKPKPFRPFAVTPDALDALATARNHDIKKERAYFADPDHWFFSLVSLQTTTAMYGAGNHQISRMNGAYGSRPHLELVRSFEYGRRFLDAVPRLLDHRRRMLDGPYGYRPDGIVLVWTVPWDGEEQLDLANLDPLYLEVARMVRLRPGDRIRAEYVPTKKSRIASKAWNGVVGDPYNVASVEQKNRKVYTPGEGGFHVDQFLDLLFGARYERTVMQEPGADWSPHEDVYFVATSIVRGQAKTNGFFDRVFRIPAGIWPEVFAGSERFRERARTARDMYDAVRRRTYAVIADRNEGEARRVSRDFEDEATQVILPWIFSDETPERLRGLLRDIIRRVAARIGGTEPVRTQQKFELERGI